MECRPHWEFFFCFFFCTQQKRLHGVLGQKMGLHSILSCRLSFGLLCNISNFHWTHFNFFTPPPPPLFLKLFSFLNNFLVLFFKPPFFDLWSNQRGFGPKNTSRGAFNLLCQADLILACHTWFIILVNMIQSMIHNLIYDLIHDPICDLIWSDPDFVYATLDTINEVQFYH